MKVGQFWSIPLPGAKFACGRVLQFKDHDGKRDKRLFLAGLLDWIGTGLPTSEGIRGSGLVGHGAAHIMTISANNGKILGCRDLALDKIEIPYTLEGTRGPRLQQGFEFLGLADEEQRSTLPTFSTWGSRVILALAEKLLEHRV
jgi:hypothetical protein